MPKARGLWVFRSVGRCDAVDEGQVSGPGRQANRDLYPLLHRGGRERLGRHGARPARFAIKFYTEDGNYDLVGNNTPVFFIRDPLKFPDFIHSQKRDPYTNIQEPDNVWDFFSLSPEATHQFTILFSDRGIPASFRHMDGFGSHTFQWINASGEPSG